MIRLRHRAEKARRRASSTYLPLAMKSFRYWKLLYKAVISVQLVTPERVLLNSVAS